MNVKSYIIRMFTLLYTIQLLQAASLSLILDELILSLMQQIIAISHEDSKALSFFKPMLFHS